jgi:hypothetical protein
LDLNPPARITSSHVTPDASSQFNEIPNAIALEASWFCLAKLLHEGKILSKRGAWVHMAESKSSPPELDSAVLAEHRADETLLVGQVLENGSATNPAHATIRWRTSEGQLNERTLPLVKGVSVAAGDLVLLQRPSNWPEWIVTQVVESLNELSLPAVPEVVVDGKRVQIEGSEEIVLRCGKASITLRSNGRLIIRGAYVETRASGTNRIKGGAVLIN